MTRARRLASVAVVASLAVTGLSACRSEPSVAAYVGDDKRITESQVQKLWDEVQDAAAPPAGEAAGQPAAVSITRTDIVRTLVSVDVLSEVAKAQSVGLPADLSLPDYANQLKLPETVEYVRLYATSDTLVRLLRAKAQSAPAPSDDDLKEVYDVLVANQGIDPGTSFDTFKTSLPAENKQLVQTSAAVRDQIEEATGKLDITVNPRYQPLSISVLEFQTQNGALRPLVVAPLGESDETSPVIDAR
ncbi:MAG: hypothetical protein ABW046_08835 [Actinoplanes sp.]